MDHNRRNIRHRPTRSGPPYNEIYETFGKYFQPIFTERLAEGLRAKTYVSVPEAEEEISGYVNSDMSEVCVITGLMGSGKSTILEHLCKNGIGAGSDVFLYLDFQGRRFHFLPPEEFLKLGEADRTIYARSVATRKINELMLPIIKDNKDLINEEFFDYLYRNNISELGASGIFASTPDEKIKLVQEFMEDSDKTAPVQCFLRYISLHRKFKSVTLVVDNVDEQPFEMVEAVFYVLTDFVACMMRPKSTSKKATSEDDPYGLATCTDNGKDVCSTIFGAILACRSHTFEALKADEGGLYQTRGSREITLTSKSILAEILRSRLDYFRKILEEQEDLPINSPQSYTLRSGMRVELKHAFDFLESLIASLLDKAIELPLFDIFNHNYARSIQNVKYLIQNRHFIVFDHSVLTGKLEDSDLRYSNVIKALGYGNPVDETDLYFPSQSTAICNILSWDPGVDRSLFSVIKVLKWLEAGGFSSDNGSAIRAAGCSVAFVVKSLEEELGLPKTTGTWAVQFCHRNGLVFAATGYKSTVPDHEMICLSPKGAVHLREVFQSAIFLEMYLDDTPTPTPSKKLIDDRQSVARVNRRPTRAHFQDTANWLQSFMDAERAQLDGLCRDDPAYVEATLRLFGRKTVSHSLIAMVDHSWKAYYENFCNRADRTRLNDLHKVASDMSRYFMTNG